MVSVVPCLAAAPLEANAQNCSRVLLPIEVPIMIKLLVEEHYY
jgi:hypothetical protein